MRLLEIRGKLAAPCGFRTSGQRVPEGGLSRQLTKRPCACTGSWPPASRQRRISDAPQGATVIDRRARLMPSPNLSSAVPRNDPSRAAIAFPKSNRPDAPLAGDAYGDKRCGREHGRLNLG